MKCLIQASRSHRNTVEQLADSLKEINDEVNACLLDRDLVRSAPMIAAVAKFYLHVFLFYGDAINWYKCKSRVKIFNSLDSSFHERFQDQLSDIHRLSRLVQRVAATGSAARIHDLGLDIGRLHNDVLSSRELLERQNTMISLLARSVQELSITNTDIKRRLESLESSETKQNLSNALRHEMALGRTELLLALQCYSTLGTRERSPGVSPSPSSR